MDWLVILAQEKAIQWVLNNQRLAFKESVRTHLLSPGDRIALYTTRAAFGNPSTDLSQIVAIGRITSEVHSSAVQIGSARYSKICSIAIDAQLRPRRGLPFKPLIPRLSFIQQKHAWSAYLQRALVPLPSEDFELISQSLRHAGRQD